MSPNEVSRSTLSDVTKRSSTTSSTPQHVLLGFFRSLRRGDPLGRVVQSVGALSIRDEPPQLNNMDVKTWEYVCCYSSLHTPFPYFFSSYQHRGSLKSID